MSLTKIEQIRKALQNNRAGLRPKLDVYSTYGLSQGRGEVPRYIDVDISRCAKPKRIKHMLGQAGLADFEEHDQKLTFLNRGNEEGE